MLSLPPVALHSCLLLLLLLPLFQVTRGPTSTSCSDHETFRMNVFIVSGQKHFDEVKVVRGFIYRIILDSVKRLRVP